jgi:mannonate dehydratase
MQMTFRWYGEGNDRIKLSDIKQIPGVKGIVWALHDKMQAKFGVKKKLQK